MLVKRTLSDDALHRHQPGRQERNQRQGQVAVGDRAAHLLRRALDVDMDPLVVARGVGELVHPLLRHLDPVGDPYFLSDQTRQVLHFHGRHVRVSPVRSTLIQ
jgi:hypothetical protein